MNRLAKILGLILLVFFINTALADAISLGDAANWLMGPVNGLGKVFGYMCLIGGIGMILGAFLQYRAHRENPSQVRLSTPVFLLIVGIILIILPYIGLLSGYTHAMIYSRGS